MPDAALGAPWFDAERYSRAEVARYVGVPSGTLGNWLRGYSYPVRGGGRRRSSPLIVPPGEGRWLSFANLAEAHAVAAFRASGVPMQRIRPALQYMLEHLDLERPLASHQLLTDGVEVFFRYVRQERDGELVALLNVSRGGQAAFAETIERYLERVDFAADGYAARVWPRGREGLVVIDPQRGFGRPIIDRRGVRVRDVLDRLRAGEPEDAVRADFDLDGAQVQAARAFGDRVYAEAA